MLIGYYFQHLQTLEIVHFDFIACTTTKNFGYRGCQLSGRQCVAPQSMKLGISFICLAVPFVRLDFRKIHICIFGCTRWTKISLFFKLRHPVILFFILVFILTHFRSTPQNLFHSFWYFRRNKKIIGLEKENKRKI